MAEEEEYLESVRRDNEEAAEAQEKKERKKKRTKNKTQLLLVLSGIKVPIKSLSLLSY